MKKLIITIMALFVYLSVQAADINSIASAFKAGNASSLTSAMDKEVDIAVPGTSKKTNATEVISILNQFFKQNTPSGFSVVHHADKKENGFLVGKLPTGSTEYRVNITYRTDGNNLIIQSIRIE